MELLCKPRLSRGPGFWSKNIIQNIMFNVCSTACEFNQLLDQLRDSYIILEGQFIKINIRGQLQKMR